MIQAMGMSAFADIHQIFDCKHELNDKFQTKAIQVSENEVLQNRRQLIKGLRE